MQGNNDEAVVNGTTVTLGSLSRSLDSCAILTRRWFELNAIAKPREDFFARNRLGDKGRGAVYAYSLGVDQVLYVGQTGRKIKSRQYDQTSPHKSKILWNQWTTIRFINMQDRMDRLKLEFMLIVAYAPEHNLAHPASPSPSGEE